MKWLSEEQVKSVFTLREMEMASWIIYYYMKGIAIANGSLIMMMMPEEIEGRGRIIMK